MPTLHRLEHPTDRSQAGVLFTWDDGTAKQAAFTVSRDLDVQGTGKRIASEVLQSLLNEGKTGLAEGTNWVSVVAGVAKHVHDAMARLPVDG